MWSLSTHRDNGTPEGMRLISPHQRRFVKSPNIAGHIDVGQSVCVGCVKFVVQQSKSALRRKELTFCCADQLCNVFGVPSPWIAADGCVGA